MRRRNPYNADGRLRLDERAWWLLLNAIDNRRPDRGVDPGLRTERFRAPAADALERLRATAGTPSPSRALCDLFWQRLPWGDLERALGPLHVVDIGCGAGDYARRFRDWSGGRVRRYVGVDAVERSEWRAVSAAHPFAAFRRAAAERIDECLEAETNLIVSQSAIEHVGDEGACFDRIHAHAHARGRPLLQLHAVPSAACLRLYLWHGYRQYTPRTISSITARFADCSERALVSLGGRRSNAVHWRWVTWPIFFRRAGDPRDRDPAAYRRDFEEAVAHDAADPDGPPSFYVLMIGSNARLPAIVAT